MIAILWTYRIEPGWAALFEAIYGPEGDWAQLFRQAHGYRGTELLRAYQLEGGSQPEPLFDVSKISDLRLLDERFEKPGPNYKRDDSAMREIFAQL